MIIVLSGPSGVGKDTVWIPAAMELGFAKRMMHTTRAPRSGERNGVDYWYASKAKFRRLLLRGQLIEWDYYFYSYYGIGTQIAEDAADSNVVFHAIARLGYRFRAKVPSTTLISLQPSSADAILERLKRKRRYGRIDMCMRRHHVMEEMDNAFLCNYAIQNAECVGVNEAKEALSKIVEVETGERSRSGRGKVVAGSSRKSTILRIVKNRL
jgi:guanylate kinase